MKAELLYVMGGGKKVDVVGGGIKRWLKEGRKYKETKSHLSMFAVSLSCKSSAPSLTLLSLFTFCCVAYKLTNICRPKVNL